MNELFLEIAGSFCIFKSDNVIRILRKNARGGGSYNVIFFYQTLL